MPRSAGWDRRRPIRFGALTNISLRSLSEMVANPKYLPETQTVRFLLNGIDIEALPDETILQAAKRVGIKIPHLCYKEGYRPDGNCRSCMVEIKGERVLAPSCCRYPTSGMEVTSNSARAVASQKMVLELLLSDMPPERHTLDSQLDEWASKLAGRKPRL